MGEPKIEWRTELVKLLKEHLERLGLQPDTELKVFNPSDASAVDWEGVIVSVWFGTEDKATRQELKLLQRALAENVPIFPVVEDLKRFRDLVPTELRPINGQVWNCQRIVTDILKEFRLTRSQRQAFISYKRDDCLEVAGQLFDLLSRRGYRIFWDSASVEGGVDFQQALWGRMADVDLLVFLDTPNALTSRWVHQELARAHDLGLGVLQLVWPAPHKRTRGTEFSDWLQLSLSDFKRGNTGPTCRLTKAALDRVSRAAELARVGSLAARRLRVVGDLVDQAKTAKLEAIVHPTNPIELYRKGKKVADVFAFVGVPDAFSIQQQEITLQRRTLRRSLILYNGLGVDPAWTKHLAWLNERRGLATAQLDMVDVWLKGL
ncbi:MAG TPA: toll/interleukin-1 receptor domain-containing protein [Pyrinomonadaceae bacterium]|nr:toll/interleukin-1 receptor domain-containing protein [Pyrinomonadaceae bacterium]